MASADAFVRRRDKLQIFEIRLVIGYCSGVLSQWRPQPQDGAQDCSGGHPGAVPALRCACTTAGVEEAASIAALRACVRRERMRKVQSHRRCP